MRSDQALKSEWVSGEETLDTEEVSSGGLRRYDAKAVVWLDGVKADEDDESEDFWMYVKGYN